LLENLQDAEKERRKEAQQKQRRQVQGQKGW
jgi:hypothetical protein